MIANGYATVQRQTLTGRALEREVFSRITARLSSTDTSAPGGQGAFYEAVCDNKKLWLTLAADLARPENTCPVQLKDGLLKIAAFVEARTAAILSGDGDADALVEINRNIISGLLGGEGASTDAATEAA